MRIGFTVFWVFAFFSIFAGIAADSVVSDSFDGGWDNWIPQKRNPYFKIVDGTLANKTPYSSYISLKERNLGDFSLNFKLKEPKTPTSSKGHFSIGLQRGYGTWNLYFTRIDATLRITSLFLPKGEKNGSKALFRERFSVKAEPDAWLDVAIIAKSDRYSLRIAGETFILGVAPGVGGISFGSYRQPVALDDLMLTFSPPLPLSPNLVINSGFEYASNPDVPDYWGGTGVRYRDQGLPNTFCTEDGLKIYHDGFFLDNSNAHSGKNSIRLKSPLHLQSKALKVREGETYTISCWARSDAPAKIAIGVTASELKRALASKTVTVNDKWTRYSITLPKCPSTALSFFVIPLEADNAIWVDDVQVEKGETPTAYQSSWMDGGFSLPFDANKRQFSKNTNAIRATLARRDVFAAASIKVSVPILKSTDAVKSLFDVSFNLSASQLSGVYSVTLAILAKTGKEQFRTAKVNFSENAEPAQLAFHDLRIEDLRCRVEIVIADPSGKMVKRTREFLDVPHPLHVYTEYSYYTKEKAPRVVANFADTPASLGVAKIKFTTMVAGYKYLLNSKTFSVKPNVRRQIFTITFGKVTPWQDYTIHVEALDSTGKVLIKTTASLIRQTPGVVDVKVNRINRGVYIDGKPFLPYGILVARYGMKELEYYKKCGFEYICYISNWQSTEKSRVFLKNCEKLGIKAIAFHVSRPYVLKPSKMMEKCRDIPSLVGVIPNDESGNKLVYKKALETKFAAPERLIWGNHHFLSYRAFANRVEGFPGDVLSIDRYPCIGIPQGRPQPINDLYSFEEVLRMMDRDGKRERKPVFCWLQAAERFSREPINEELVWMTYVALTNHCMGFNYFGGIPHSKVVWDNILRLRGEVETLKPYLFSLEAEPVVKVASKSVRFLTKRLGGEVLLITVNGTFESVEGAFDLSAAGIDPNATAEVMFENRTVNLKNGLLKDGFTPFQRHVYRFK